MRLIVISIFAILIGISSRQGLADDGSTAGQPQSKTETTSANPNDDSKPLVLPDFSKITEQQPKEGGKKPRVFCKTPDGRLIHPGEIGYETCLANGEQAPINLERDGRGQQPESSTSMGFQIGK
jgi:hypothetical protein